MPVELPDDAPQPRLCLILKSSPSQEYGYNLHAERGKPQFIGTVDANSPADCGGLRPGDRIFAVNGASIIGENHKQVVQRIKENALQCELLVISEEGLEWYKRRNISITPSLPNIINCYKVMQERIMMEKWDSKLSPNSAKTSVLKPRLCKLRKKEPSEEFGFNLHAEEKRGHFVGAVDKDGIGERAGLEMGQRIVGVNGQIIYPTTAHKKVVSLIKMNPLRTDLLVASEEVDNWFNDNNEAYSFENADIYNSENDAYTEQLYDTRRMQSEEKDMPERDDVAEEEEYVMERKHSNCDAERAVLPYNEGSFVEEVIYAIEKEQEAENSSVSAHSVTKMTASVAPLKQTEAPSIPYEEKKFGNNAAKDKQADMDIFMLNAVEARNRLMMRGKKDPRRDMQMSLKEKYQLVSNM